LIPCGAGDVFAVLRDEPEVRCAGPVRTLFGRGFCNNSCYS
jgi:hypothetical protein